MHPPPDSCATTVSTNEHTHRISDLTHFTRRRPQFSFRRIVAGTSLQRVRRNSTGQGPSVARSTACMILLNGHWIMLVAMKLPCRSGCLQPKMCVCRLEADHEHRWCACSHLSSRHKRAPAAPNTCTIDKELDLKRSCALGAIQRDLALPMILYHMSFSWRSRPEV